ncbi:MAG: hypothetical protein HFH68_08155 [Lachnospiraceae bacterium]|nr:hypothetical protein [Lachnospiraceae bacterium]
MAKAKRPVRKKEKLSKEENLYRSAASLMEAVDCISRFERVVYSLNDAANKFDKLDGYKDSARLGEKCRRDAEEAARKGAQEAYITAVDKLGRAKDKSSFADAAEDFKRAKKFGYNPEECNNNIQICKNGIKRAETKAMLKRQGIVLCVIIILAVVFVNTPFYPLVKGIYYQSRGEYKAAIGLYKKSGGVLVGNGNMKECYYYIAEKYNKEGSYVKALANYKKAKNKFDAVEKAFVIEKKLIAEALPGDIAIYGSGEWVVLSKTKRQALLFAKKDLPKKKFDKDGKSVWYGSSLCNWLNTEFIKEFSPEERSIIAGQGMINEKDREIISILDKVQYEKYKDIIKGTNKSYWLKDSGSSDGNVCYVKEDASISEAPSDEDNISVRSSLWVVFG